MRNILIIGFVMLSAISWAQNKSKTKVADFYLEYASSAKTIIIKGNTVTLHEWIEQYDNPVSSMPSMRKEVAKTAVVSSADLAALKNLVKSSGYMTLAKNEYGASEEDRAYLYSLVVNTNGKQKKVVYRSNPSPQTEQAPKAFSELEKKVNEIVSSIKEWK